MLTTTPTPTLAPLTAELLGQTVVVIGGGLETARRARAEGADVIQVSRDPEQFFDELLEPVDHVIVAADWFHHLDLARVVAGKVRAGGTLLFVDGSGPTVGWAVTVGLPALIANLALELAPVRVNLIATGFVGTPEDVAALALHVMASSQRTGATYDIPRGRQLLPLGV